MSTLPTIPQETKEPPQPTQKDLFVEKSQNVSAPTEKNVQPTVAQKKKKRIMTKKQLAALARAREKSLIARRKKKEEKIKAKPTITEKVIMKEQKPHITDPEKKPPKNSFTQNVRDFFGLMKEYNENFTVSRSQAMDVPKSNPPRQKKVKDISVPKQIPKSAYAAYFM